MRPIYISRQVVMGAESSGWVVLDQYTAPANASVTVKLTQKTSTTPTGTVTAVYTNDDVFDPSLPNFVGQPYTASPFDVNGVWSLTGFSGVGSVVAVEAMYSYAPRAIKIDLNLTAGEVVFEVQVVQLGIAST